jgi:hypothetical protein
MTACSKCAHLSPDDWRRKMCENRHPITDATFLQEMADAYAEFERNAGPWLRAYPKETR